MGNDFQGKVALVTGVGSGIGAAVAKELTAQGASIIAADIRQDAAQATIDQITAAGGKATIFVGDASKPEDVKASVDLALSTYGKLDLAFNNAGITGPLGHLDELDIAAYRRLMDVNLDSVFYGMLYEVPVMLAGGGGAIVNTASILGLVGSDTAIPYTAAKHGVSGMTKAAAIAYAAKGIRINSVHPGYIDTPLLGFMDDQARRDTIALHPMGRLGRPEEIAQVVVFLLSDKASFVTGSQYVADGGYTAQ